jgi:hypothetical protein
MPQLDFGAKKPQYDPKSFCFPIIWSLYFWKLIFWYQTLFSLCFSYCMLSDEREYHKKVWREREYLNDHIFTTKMSLSSPNELNEVMYFYNNTRKK